MLHAVAALPAHAMLHQLQAEAWKSLLLTEPQQCNSIGRCPLLSRPQSSAAAEGPGVQLT